MIYKYSAIVFLLLISVITIAAQEEGTDPQGVGAIVTVSVPPGSYSYDQQIELVTGAGYQLYYTFAESTEPKFIQYVFPFVLSALPGEERSYTLRVEVRLNGQSAKKKEFFYVIDKKAPKVPALNLNPGIYRESVELLFENDDEKIFFTVNDNIQQNRQVWDDSPIVLSGEEGGLADYKIQAFSVDAADNMSAVYEWRYVIDRQDRALPVALKIYSPVEGVFANKQLLVIDDNPFEWIRFTLDGKDPGEFGAAYTGPFLIDLTGDVAVRAVGKLKDSDSIKSARVTYSVREEQYLPVTPSSGIYDESLLIRVEGKDKVYYSVEEKSPDRDMLEYSRPIRLETVTEGIKYSVLRLNTLKGIQNDAAQFRFFYILDDRTPSAPDIHLSRRPPLSSPSRVKLDGPPGTAVYFTIDGTTPDSSSPAYDGPFVLDLPKDTDAGSIFIKAVAIGFNGRKSEPASTLVTYDKVPPATPELTYIGKTRSSSLAVGVQSEFGSRILYEITVDDSPPPAPGPESPVTDGLLELTAPYGMETIFSLRFAAIDDAGNISDPSETFRLLVDRIPPDPPNIALVDGTIEISGEGSVYYTVSLDGSEPEFPGSSSDEYISPIPFDILDGKINQIAVRAVSVDNSGNFSEVSATFSATVDNRKPFMPPIKGAIHGGVYKNTVALAVDKIDDTVDVLYSFTSDGTEPEDPDVAAPVLPDELLFEGRDGEVVEYILKLRPVLVNGNLIGEVSALAFTVDREPPVPPKASGFSNGAVYRHGVEITPPAIADETYYLTISNDAAVSADPFGPSGRLFNNPLFIDVPSGVERDYYIRFGAEDGAGNRAVNEAVYRFTIDKKPPDVPEILGVPPGGFTRQSVIIQLKNEADTAFYEYTTDGTLPESPNAASNRFFGELSFDGEENKEVQYALSFVHIDDAGNSSDRASARFTIDRSPPPPPAAPKVSLPETSRPFFTFSWQTRPEEKLYYRVTADEAAEQEAYAQYTGPVSFSVAPGRSEITLSYYYRDKAGNISEVVQSDYEFMNMAADRFLSGVENEAIYNSRKVINKASDFYVLRYEVTADGSEPMPVTRFSKTMPDSLSFDAVEGETIVFSLRVALFPEDDGERLPQEELVTFTIDKTPPPPPRLVRAEENLYFQEDVTLELEAEEGDIFVSVNGREFSKYTGAITLSSETGTINVYNVAAYTRDGAGNRSTATIEETVRIDKAVIYVASSGNDLYDGSQARPYRTVSKAIKLLKSSSRKIIYLAEGTYQVTEPIVLSDDILIEGGMNAESWQRTAVNARSVLVPGIDFPAGEALVQCTGNRVALGNISVFSGENESISSLLLMKDAELVARDSTFDSNGGLLSSMLKFENGNASLENVSVVGRGVKAPYIEISGTSFEISASTVSGGGSDFDLVLLRASNASEINIADTRFEPENGKRTISLEAHESRVNVERSVFGTGTGRTGATAIYLFDCDAVLNKVTVRGSEDAWISSGVDFRFSTVSILDSVLESRADRGSIALRSNASDLDVQRTSIVGMGGTEFVYLVQLQDSTAYMVNNVLRGSVTRDSIGIQATGSDFKFINNTIVTENGTNVAYGLRMKDNDDVLILNNIIDVSGAGKHRVAIDVSGSLTGYSVLNNCFGGWDTIWKSIKLPVAQSVGELDLLDHDAGGGAYHGNIAEPAELSFADPTQVQLKATSQCVDGGFDPGLLGEIIREDFFGQLRPKAHVSSIPTYDIGADEYHP